MSIPEDLMKTARELAAQVGRNQAVYYEWDDDVLKRHLAENAEAIASALMAERERAAQTAEHYAQMWDKDTGHDRPNDGFDACMEAAAAIRNA